MTRPDAERELRELMRSRVATLRPPIGVYDTVRVRHRRFRRRAVTASALAVVAVLVGIPLGLGRWHSGPPEPAAIRPAPEIRGSLAGEQPLLAEARKWAEEKVFTGPDRMDPRTARVRYAEQQEGYIVVLVVGRRVADGGVSHAFLGRRAGQRGFAVVGEGSIRGTDPDRDARLGQAYLDPLHLLTRVEIGDRSFGVAIFPPGYRLTVARRAALRADCRIEALPEEPVSLLDGAAFIPIGRDARPYATVADTAGVVFLRRVLTPSQSAVPPSEVARGTAQIRSTIRGTIDEVSLRLAVAGARSTSGLGTAETPQRYLGVWSGRQPGNSGYSHLVGVQYASGAVILVGAYETSHTASGSGGRGWAMGCLPADAQDDVVLSARLIDLPGQPLIVVGPAATARVDAVFADETVVPMPLTGGGGFLQRAGTVVNVRAYDADGRLLAEGAPGQGLLPMPLGGP